ncbi:LysR family transcriptional regulator [Segeticoccus rhizosphaerae]|jgi:DNA-binding transcriptional LysR family regulator|uniref:LysR family transcriptional regulator n=1 Tax=Segeticoccus rhizosphaerae TaxID=1104777 RepID=UPI0010C06144|nr:LysR family transcriptional regulator [Ornithinicoccus soli]
MLNPVHLTTLVAVVGTGSFADAARQLGYTGSAVSQQIAALERAVKMPLFERSAHSIQPTPAAEFLAARARDSLASLRTLEDDIQGVADGTTGRIRIGSFPTASEHLLPEALAHLLVERPGVEILLDEGETDDLVERLRDGEMDLALVYHYDLVPRRWPRTLQATPLLDEDLVLLLPERHARATDRPVLLEDLREERWVSTRVGTAGATCLLRLCSEHDFDPTVAVRSNDYDVIRGFVRTGLGIALVPALSHISSRGVDVTHLADVTVRRHVTALHRSPRHNPAVTGALDALEHAADHLVDLLPGVSAPGTG